MRTAITERLVVDGTIARAWNINAGLTDDVFVEDRLAAIVRSNRKVGTPIRETGSAAMPRMNYVAAPLGQPGDSGFEAATGQGSRG